MRVLWPDPTRGATAEELAARMPFDATGIIPTWDSARRRWTRTVIKHGALPVLVRKDINGAPFEGRFTLIAYDAQKETDRADRARGWRASKERGPLVVAILTNERNPNAARRLELCEAYLLRFQIEQAFRVFKAGHGLDAERVQVRRWERTVNLFSVVGLLSVGFAAWLLKNRPALADRVVARAPAGGDLPAIRLYRCLMGLQRTLAATADEGSRRAA